MESWTVYKDTKNNGWWEKSDMKFYPFGHFVFTTINTCAAISQGKEKFLENEYYYLMRLNNPDYNLLMGYTDKNGTVSKRNLQCYAIMLRILIDLGKGKMPLAICSAYTIISCILILQSAPTYTIICLWV